MELDKLLSLANEFTIDDKQIILKENLLNNFNIRFPKDKLANLELKDYIAAGSQDTIAYWLEFRKEILEDLSTQHGVGGGSARKFGIYQEKSNNDYKSGKSVKQSVTYSNYDEANKYFKENILNVIIDTIVNFNEKDIYKYDTNNTTIAPSILLRLLHIYYPNIFLSITQFATLEKIAIDLNIDTKSINRNNLIILNYTISQKIKEMKVFENWHYHKIGSFFWEITKQHN
jgi:hypothetical protein